MAILCNGNGGFSTRLGDLGEAVTLEIGVDDAKELLALAQWERFDLAEPLPEPRMVAVRRRHMSFARTARMNNSRAASYFRLEISCGIAAKPRAS
jgi:hypothetical protein